MANKNKVAIVSVLIALVALLILIFSLTFVIMSTPAQGAKVENIIEPFTSKTSYDQPSINIYNSGDDDDDDDDEDPVIRGLPDVTLGFGQSTTIDLDAYASDDEDSHSELDFDVIYTATESPAQLTLDFNSTTHVLTITETNGAWEGTQAITIEVEDTDGNTDSDSFTVTISNGTTSSTSPVISGLPDVEFTENTSYTLNLNDYVSDADNNDLDLTWTYSGNTNVLISIDASNRATFTATAGWTGEEDITFRVQDPSGNYDEDIIEVEVNEAVSWSALSDQTIQGNSTAGTVVYENLMSMVSGVDLDDADDIEITLSSGLSALGLKISGSDLVLSQDIPTERVNGVETAPARSGTVTLEVNGVSANFELNVLACVEFCTFESCYWICE